MSSMVLRYTSLSPFSRKVLLLAIERGLMSRLGVESDRGGETHVSLATPGA